MPLYIINKFTPLNVKILRVVFFVFVLSLFFTGYYINKKQIEEENNRKVHDPLTNLTYEITKIKKMYGDENVKELQLNGNTITFKIEQNSNLEPLISRYQNMIKIIFNEKGYNFVTIDKKNIISNKVVKQLENTATKETQND